MATRQALRSQLRLLIGETDSNNSHLTDDELNGYLNEALTFLAVQAEWPRDIAEIQVSEGTPVYTLPTDTLLISKVYYGDKSIRGDMKDIRILNEKELAELRPGWLDEHTDSRGVPDTAVLIDRHSIMLNPSPDAASSATGKKLYISYVYYPDSMSSDSDEPDLPLSYHNLLKFYGAHLCYLGKLNNVSIANQMLKTMMDELKILQSASTREIEQGGFSWGNDNNFEDDSDLTVIP